MWRSVVTPLYVYLMYLYLSLVWFASWLFVWCLVIPQLCLRSWTCCFVSSKSFDGQITLICLFIHPFQPVPYLKQLQIHCDSLGFILLLSCAWFHTVSILALLHLGLASLMSVISCNLCFQPWPFSHNKGVFRGGGRKTNSCSHHIGNWHFHSNPPPSPQKNIKEQPIPWVSGFMAGSCFSCSLGSSTTALACFQRLSTSTRRVTSDQSTSEASMASWIKMVYAHDYQWVPFDPFGMAI